MAWGAVLPVPDATPRTRPGKKLSDQLGFIKVGCRPCERRCDKGGKTGHRLGDDLHKLCLMRS